MKDQLGARSLALEILKTGRRMWVTVKMDPKEETINVDEFMKAREKLRNITREIYENTQTDLVLERP